MTTSSEGRRYRILGILGQGGFGTVYRAELLGEGGFKRQVALKVLNPEMEGVSGVAGRLRDEARLLGMLRHRAILQVDGLVRLDDRWTIVMEYIEGVDLSLLMPRGAVPAGPALEIVGEVASALHIAYSWPGEGGEPLKLLHRDLKPTNILLTSAGETKVLDFGIARANFDGREAVTKSVLFGSPGYMAPERFDLEEGPGGDVYSLGVVLFEVLAGQAFGKASTHPAKHAQLVENQVFVLERLKTPEPVRALLSRMLSYEPEARPTAREVETACRDLRSKVQGAWLRDWAEQTVPPLLVNRGVGGQHDFSDSILMERSGAAAGNATTGFELSMAQKDAVPPHKSGGQAAKPAPTPMPGLALPTFDGSEEPPPPPPPKPPPAPKAATPPPVPPSQPKAPPPPPVKEATPPPAPKVAEAKPRSQLISGLQRNPPPPPQPLPQRPPAERDSGVTLFLALTTVIGLPVVVGVTMGILMFCCGFAGSI